jgi:nitroreductase
VNLVRREPAGAGPASAPDGAPVPIVEFLLRRRSVPANQLRAPGPSAAQLDELLTVAARVPDHGKLAPFRFLLVDAAGGAALGETLAALTLADKPEAEPALLARERGRFTAPLVVIVISRAAPDRRISEWDQVLVSGAVCMNLLVAAGAMGFGATWLSDWFAHDRRFLDRLGLEPHEKIAGFIHIGSSDFKPPERARPDVAELVTRWTP